MLNHYLAPPNPTFDCFVEGVPISQRDLETSRCHLWILRHPLRCANKCSWILMSVHDELLIISMIVQFIISIFTIQSLVTIKDHMMNSLDNTVADMLLFSALTNLFV